MDKDHQQWLEDGGAKRRGKKKSHKSTLPLPRASDESKQDDAPQDESNHWYLGQN